MIALRALRLFVIAGRTSIISSALYVVANPTRSLRHAVSLA
jgi:hypothetical protein